jgi:hypothetical protein
MNEFYSLRSFFFNQSKSQFWPIFIIFRLKLLHARMQRNTFSIYLLNFYPHSYFCFVLFLFVVHETHSNNLISITLGSQFKSFTLSFLLFLFHSNGRIALEYSKAGPFVYKKKCNLKCKKCSLIARRFMQTPK